VRRGLLAKRSSFDAERYVVHHAVQVMKAVKGMEITVGCGMNPQPTVK
jgi:hypothetical protein